MARDIAGFNRNIARLLVAANEIAQSPEATAQACAARMRRDHAWVSRSGRTEGSIQVFRSGVRQWTLRAGIASLFLEFGTRKMRSFPFYRRALAGAPEDVKRQIPALRERLYRAVR